jgi:uncharacterized membrane protein YebE (DUF533 family)
MVDFGDLLRQIQQDGLSGRSLERIRHAVSQGGLGQIGDKIKGMVSGGQGGGAQDMLGQAKDLLAKRDKRMIGGIGAALGVLLGGGLVKGGIGGALMAILGTAAYDALNKGTGGQATTASQQPEAIPVGMRPPETPEEAEVLETRAVLALKAMIAAAKADGQIDARERERILARMKDAGADGEIRDFIDKEVAAPLDIDALVRDVPDAQTAAQVYAASLLAINVDTEAERAYLRELAAKLGLDAQVVANLHGALGAPTVA